MRKFSKMLTVGLAAALVFGMNVNAQEVKNPSIITSGNGITSGLGEDAIVSGDAMKDGISSDAWKAYQEVQPGYSVVPGTEVVEVLDMFRIDENLIDPNSGYTPGDAVTITFDGLYYQDLGEGERYVLYHYTDEGKYVATEPVVWNSTKKAYVANIASFSLYKLAKEKDVVAPTTEPSPSPSPVPTTEPSPSPAPTATPEPSYVVTGVSNWGGTLLTDVDDMKAGMTEEAWTIFKSNKPLLGFDVDEKQVLWPVPGGEFRMDCPQYWDGSDVTVFFSNMPVLDKDNDESFALYRYDVATGKYVEEVKVYENTYTHRYEATLKNLDDWSLWRLYIVKGSPVHGGEQTYLPGLEQVGVAGANSTPTGVAATAANGTPVSPKTGETLPVAGMAAVLCLAGAVVCAKKVRCNG